MTTRAFTLIELLCTTAVMLLIFGILFQISGNVLKVSTMSRQEMDANQRTRAVLDSLEGDLKNIVNQYKATVLVSTDGTNTQLAFLTYNRGPILSASSGRYLAVAYWLYNGTSGTSGLLMRSYASVTASNTNPMQAAATLLTSSTGTSAVSSTGTSGVSVIADSILRFEAVAVLDNGQVSSLNSLPTACVSGTNVPTSLVLSSSPSLSSTAGGVRALTVGVAALDSKSYRLPGATGIAAKLPVSSPTTGGQVDTLTPYGMWSGVVSGTSGTLVTPSIPKPAVTALRMAQNTFSLK